jgi:hypothetical protein
LEQQLKIQWIVFFNGKSTPETIDFPIRYGGFPGDFPLKESVDIGDDL